MIITIIVNYLKQTNASALCRPCLSCTRTDVAEVLQTYHPSSVHGKFVLNGGKKHKVQVHDSYLSPNIIRKIKRRRIIDGTVACMEGT
jgi:hypothetical protein